MYWAGCNHGAAICPLLQMKLGILQYSPAYLKKHENLATVEALLQGCDADLIVLPELFASGYFFRNKDDLALMAEPVPDGETTRRLEQWAREMGTSFVAGLPEVDGDVFYNSAVVVSPSGVEGVYRKVHLFYQEKLFFERGNLGFRCFDLTDRAGTPYRLGVMICFDWYFPEAARSLAMQHADIIAHPSNLVRKSCPSSMPVRALENHVFTATANRYGAETKDGETLTFIGQSVICNPEGDVLLKAGREETLLGIVEIDPAHARDRQITPYNHLLNDRRPETYVVT